MWVDLVQAFRNYNIKELLPNGYRMSGFIISRKRLSLMNTLIYVDTNRWLNSLPVPILSPYLNRVIVYRPKGWYLELGIKWEGTIHGWYQLALSQGIEADDKWRRNPIKCIPQFIFTKSAFPGNWEGWQKWTPKWKQEPRKFWDPK